MMTTEVVQFAVFDSDHNLLLRLYVLQNELFRPMVNLIHAQCLYAEFKSNATHSLFVMWIRRRQDRTCQAKRRMAFCRMFDC